MNQPTTLQPAATVQPMTPGTASGQTAAIGRDRLFTFHQNDEENLLYAGATVRYFTRPGQLPATEAVFASVAWHRGLSYHSLGIECATGSFDKKARCIYNDEAANNRLQFIIRRTNALIFLRDEEELPVTGYMLFSDHQELEVAYTHYNAATTHVSTVIEAMYDRLIALRSAFIENEGPNEDEFQDWIRWSRLFMEFVALYKGAKAPLTQLREADRQAFYDWLCQSVRYDDDQAKATMYWAVESLDYAVGQGWLLANPFEPTPVPA
jgi:hypothetical protein